VSTPRLVGVVHVPPLPASPRSALAISAIAESVRADARVLRDAGFDAIIVENFGDAPFEKGSTLPVTVAAMTRLALEITREAPAVPLGINVLRNDAEAALGIALAVGAAFVRINVHVGARLTDQGVIEGRAAHTLRARRSMGAEHVAIWADVDVKHSAPMAPYPLAQEVEDVTKRGLADAVLVTGDGTGKPVDAEKVRTVSAAAGGKPVYIASGATVAAIAGLLAAGAYGVIVGSVLRADGRAGGPIDAAAASRFADAWKSAVAHASPAR
jgi:membrane complex biogenesis BtpA family protein